MSGYIHSVYRAKIFIGFVFVCLLLTRFYSLCDAGSGNGLRLFLLSADSLTESTNLINLVKNSAEDRRDNVSLNYLAGMLLYTGGEYKDAIVYLQRAHKLSPNHSIIAYWLGKSYEQTRDYANALIVMHLAANEHYFPPNVLALSDAELVILAQALIEHPSSAYARFKLAKCVYGINSDLAYQLFELAFETAPTELDYSLGTARFYYTQKELEAAESFGYRALSKFPDNAWVNLFWGTLKRANGALEEAMIYLEKVTREPDSAASRGAYIELSKIYILRSEYHVAIDTLNDAEQIGANLFTLSLLRAEAYMGLHDCERAQEHLEIAELNAVSAREQSIYLHFKKLVAQTCP